jgi:transcriptional regulator with XRE-family HTH domain
MKRERSTRPEDYDLKTFGGRLLFSLARANLNQPELGRRVELSKAAINQLCAKKQEQGGGRSIARIADVLDVPLEWLAYNRGDGPKDSGIRPYQPRGALTQTPSQFENFPEVQGSLQRATLETLARLMAQGNFSDADCVRLLHELMRSNSLGGGREHDEERLRAEGSKQKSDFVHDVPSMDPNQRLFTDF